MKDNKYENYVSEIKPGKMLDRYWMFIIVLLSLFTVVMVGLIVFTQTQVKKSKDSETKYQYHYMFISQTRNSFISDRIYEEAKKHGKENEIYVEQLGRFSDSNYGTRDYLKMAMDMKVDGIILEGSDDEEVRLCINQASDSGIPVVTILSDCAGSRRKSFIELGDYNLGREYGRVVINITETRTPKVVLLMNEAAKEKDNENQIETGIRETFKNEGNHLQVQFSIQQLEISGEYSSSDKISEILLDEKKRPDILICMNEKDTKLVYQSLIDYNLEGEVKIIGSCVSESLLKAVRDGGIAALIDVNTEQTGVLCVDALNDYIEKGRVNNYIIVDDTVITSANVERYIKDE